MKNDFSGLKGTWLQLGDVTERALNWLNDAKKVPAVKNEFEASLCKLEDIAYNARRRANECNTRSCIALFGESQVGKSYLVSTFASDVNGKLMTTIADKTYDFIRDINPDGGGKESTGLVTRFSTQIALEENKDFPIRLRLLQECEIVKILLDSYFNDFDGDVGQVSQDKISEVKNRLSQVKVGGPKYIKVDEVISLQNFVKAARKGLYENLGDDYWNLARRRLMYADTDMRAEYYSVLWNDVGDGVFTNLFKRLAGTLQKLGAEKEVFAQTDSIVPLDGNKASSLINVDALNMLDAGDRDELVQVLANYQRCMVRKSELAALTAELCINIANTPKQSILKNMDMLDFPGYRGRLQCTDRDLRESVFGGQGRSRVPELFLRGKVSYLFARYADTMEINTLVFCTSADNQVNSKMNEALRRWIETTQGKTPEERSKHECGLFWAMTKFDKRISSDIDKNSAVYGKNGLLKQVALERFGTEKWFENWSGTESMPKPFNNIFLVRKPGLTETVFIDSNDGYERNIKADFADKIASMRQSFVNDKDVAQCVNDPEAAWDAMMELNDGGVGRICRNISFEHADETRYQMMKNALKTECEKGRLVLEKWYSPEDLNELEQKRKQSLRSIVSSYRNKNNPNLQFCWASVLHLFSLQDAEIRTLYLQDDSLCINDESDLEASFDEATSQRATDTENSMDAILADSSESSSASNDNDLSLSDDELFNFDDLVPDEDPETQNCGNDSKTENNSSQIPGRVESFGSRIFKKWVDSVREKAGSFRPTTLMPLSTNDMNFLADMMINQARKENLEQKLIDRIEEIDRCGAAKEDLWPVVVSSVRMMISDFVSHSNNQAPNVVELDDHKLPILGAKPVLPGFEFGKNWMQSFTNHILNSADMCNENGLSEGQNRQLGQLRDSYIKYGELNG